MRTPRHKQHYDTFDKYVLTAKTVYKRKFSRVEKILATLIAEKWYENRKFTLTDSDFAKLGTLIKDKIPACTIKLLIKNSEFKNMIDEKIKEIFRQNGWTEKDIATKLNDTYILSKEKGDPKYMIEAINVAREVMDMTKSHTMVQTKQLEASMPKGMLAAEKELDSDYEVENESEI